MYSKKTSTFKDLEILNSLSERDIVCSFYYYCLKMTIREIARQRRLNRGVVFCSIRKFRKIEHQEELVSAFNELFNYDRQG